MVDIDDGVLQSLYVWVDRIPLSRVKRNISRDFSDGVLMAEVMKYFFPKYVNLHNFATCNSSEAKKKNWQLLNWKVFKKFNFELSDDVIDSLVAAKTGTIEKVLLLLRTKIESIVSDENGKTYDCSPLAVDIGTSPVFKGHIRRTPSLQAIPRSMSPSANISQRLRCMPSNQGSRRTLAMDQDVSNSVPRMFYEDKVQECLALEETVEILNAKIRRLETLMKLKDSRIEELQKGVSELRLKARL
ncbi:unnamed protein product [Calicophoron daubneyi]|uniref:Calponin-homology (CH) domain-containing protein n=1 Tax=Calicophoron daubneyi TaxID=300641 RepID=A0AAV2TJQ0_CALDB